MSAEGVASLLRSVFAGLDIGRKVTKNFLRLERFLGIDIVKTLDGRCKDSLNIGTNIIDTALPAFDIFEKRSDLLGEKLDVTVNVTETKAIKHPVRIFTEVVGLRLELVEFRKGLVKILLLLVILGKFDRSHDLFQIGHAITAVVTGLGIRLLFLLVLVFLVDVDDLGCFLLGFGLLFYGFVLFIHLLPLVVG